MKRLRLAGVTYLGGHPDHSDVIDDLHLLLDRSGVSIQRRVRTLFSIRWPALTSLDVLTLADIERERRGWRFDFIFSFPSAEAIQTRTSGSDWGVLELRTEAFPCWLLVLDLPVHGLRELLASWASQAAGAGRRARWTTKGDRGGMTAHPVELADKAVGMWRAAGLGREPLTDRNTLAYRLAIAENHWQTGNIPEAIALLESLVVQSAKAFGAGDADTLVVRDMLAYCKGVTGLREEAIWLYWQLLDDWVGAGGEPLPVVKVARQNLARLHDPGWQP